jgi:hypothetical protein
MIAFRSAGPRDTLPERQRRRTMSNNNVEVGFSGNINTMLGIALVTAAIALALAVWSLSRINDLEAFVAVQAIRSAQEAKQ